MLNNNLADIPVHDLNTVEKEVKLPSRTKNLTRLNSYKHKHKMHNLTALPQSYCPCIQLIGPGEVLLKRKDIFFLKQRQAKFTITQFAFPC